MSNKDWKKVQSAMSTILHSLAATEGPCLFCKENASPGDVGVIMMPSENGMGLMGYRVCVKCLTEKSKEDIALAAAEEYERRPLFDATDLPPDQFSGLMRSSSGPH